VSRQLGEKKYGMAVQILNDYRMFGVVCALLFALRFVIFKGVFSVCCSVLQRVLQCVAVIAVELSALSSSKMCLFSDRVWARGLMLCVSLA